MIRVMLTVWALEIFSINKTVTFIIAKFKNNAHFYFSSQLLCLESPQIQLLMLAVKDKAKGKNYASSQLPCLVLSWFLPIISLSMMACYVKQISWTYLSFGHSAIYGIHVFKAGCFLHSVNIVSNSKLLISERFVGDQGFQVSHYVVCHSRIQCFIIKSCMANMRREEICEKLICIIYLLNLHGCIYMTLDT